MSWTEKTRGLRTCHRLLLDLTSGEIQAHREGEAPAEPQERKTLSKKAQQELRPPEGLATKQFFCNAGVDLTTVNVWTLPFYLVRARSVVVLTP